MTITYIYICFFFISSFLHSYADSSEMTSEYPYFTAPPNYDKKANAKDNTRVHGQHFEQEPSLSPLTLQASSSMVSTTNCFSSNCRDRTEYESSEQSRECQQNMYSQWPERSPKRMKYAHEDIRHNSHPNQQQQRTYSNFHPSRYVDNGFRNFLSLNL